jgi:hypothetical protein
MQTPVRRLVSYATYPPQRTSHGHAQDSFNHDNCDTDTVRPAYYRQVFDWDFIAKSIGRAPKLGHNSELLASVTMTKTRYFEINIFI